MSKELRSLASYLGLKWPDIRSLLAITIVAGMFFIFNSLLTHEVPEGNRDTTNILLGAVTAAAGVIIQFFFGSSKGSENKDAVMARIAEQPTGTGNGTTVNATGDTTVLGDPVNVTTPLPEEEPYQPGAPK